MLEPSACQLAASAASDSSTMLMLCWARSRCARAVARRQPRPMFGRLPWFAFERRSRTLRFLVFFDMAGHAIAAFGLFGGVGERLGQRRVDEQALERCR